MNIKQIQNFSYNNQPSTNSAITFGRQANNKVSFGKNFNFKDTFKSVMEEQESNKPKEPLLYRILNFIFSPEVPYNEPPISDDIASEFAQNISQNVKENYAMTDTSDGLLDALSNIANESNVVIDADFDKIPYDKDIMCFPDWQDLVLFGGEDYQIVATVPQNFEGGVVIGQVKQSSKIGVNLKINGVEKFFTKADVENKIFNHWRQK